MSLHDVTCWTMIREAAAGSPDARETFARRYLPCVRAYLAARWRGSPLARELEDTIQNVFLDCFREGGALARLDRGQASSFRAFLYGLTRNCALHAETRRAREHARRGDEPFHPESVEQRELSLSKIFDQEWARGILVEAIHLHSGRSAGSGADALRRVELLRLRFEDGLPIRDIATRWNEDPARVHTEYAQARKEFFRALREVLGFSETTPIDRVKEECQRLLELLAGE